MKHVSLADARANITELLDEVERGETITISRDGGRSVAVAPPFEESNREDARRAIEELKELRKKSGPATAEEIIAWRDEGRRF
ncbi:type II toxin-antitoxin system Phd/YefM family antitoxin [Rhodopseudomonas palustris]|uniref:Antitoxin n=1 Tax=Rhodopseudomonas palustris TaxID=1076 RepID=A0A418VI38_RHOPL|nr:type II toxin-antitoxin system prevent-host-death family antitoxin [Rhodopseudomonas palustris]RJF75753.1 type II toxin-antitoxin system Phd/YefM family antitoxin [Rhodopseudomonas palustris]